jgi:hypothetical protein
MLRRLNPIGTTFQKVEYQIVPAPNSRRLGGFRRWYCLRVKPTMKCLQ